MKSEDLINNLITHGWHSEAHFIPHKLCDELALEFKNWKPAEIGKGLTKTRETSIRSDDICWIDNHNPSTPESQFLQLMEQLKLALNRELFLGLHELECHFAKYQQGGFYKKHIDQHRESSQRKISVIVYLNTPSSGGELVIYNKHETHKIECTIKPEKAKIVCFMSDQIYHEVLSAEDERLSIAGWFRTRDSSTLL